VFVVAIFMDPEFAEIDRVLQSGGIVFVSVFVVASGVAWFAAGRILRPVRLLTETANSISESNWTQRIPVTGTDEIAGLTRTFNAMLDRLQESFTTQRRFLDDAGHELRTPITIIRGHLEVMGEDPEEREEVKLLVLDELERMSRIVDDLLLLARAEQAGFLVVRPLDVSELTDEIVTKASAMSSEREWRLQEKAFVVVRADRHRLTQALMNLVRNAIEHSPEDSRITIGSRDAGDWVHFWVRDEGEGIPPDERERIFDRFVRGKVGHGPTDGAGLGLSIVKAIVESHGGSVRVSSRLGAGSTFTLTIPVAGPPDVT
jgi:signal transduction histidine kinase